MSTFSAGWDVCWLKLSVGLLVPVHVCDNHYHVIRYSLTVLSFGIAGLKAKPRLLPGILLGQESPMPALPLSLVPSLVWKVALFSAAVNRLTMVHTSPVVALVARTMPGEEPGRKCRGLLAARAHLVIIETSVLARDGVLKHGGVELGDGNHAHRMS